MCLCGFSEKMFLVSSLSENPAGQDLRLRECARGALAGDPPAFISALAAFFEKSCVNGFLRTQSHLKCTCRAEGLKSPCGEFFCKARNLLSVSIL